MKIEDWGLLPYTQAYERQLAYVQQRIEGVRPDTLVFVEHPAVYTIGTRPESQRHLIASEGFMRQHSIAVCPTNRGGDITHHAPGQLVVYPIILLKEKDLHAYLRRLEENVIQLLRGYNLPADRLEGKTGVWIGSRKIAAIGVAVRQWVTYHGLALNVNNDLRLFEGIVPCGLSGVQVTSLAKELGDRSPTLADIKKAFIDKWNVVV
jgi:lipoyl(octanoyl) transferase